MSLPKPPVAERREHRFSHHGVTIDDPYAWLRDPGYPGKIGSYLGWVLPHYAESFLDWWREMGPDGFQEKDVWLRTAIDVGSEGWAHFDYVKMPDYRWGIFLATPDPARQVNFGEHKGDPAWQDVPGEHRAEAKR